MDTLLNFYLDRIHALERKVRELQAEKDTSTRRLTGVRTRIAQSLDDYRAFRRANEVV